MEAAKLEGPETVAGVTSGAGDFIVISSSRCGAGRAGPAAGPCVIAAAIAAQLTVPSPTRAGAEFFIADWIEKKKALFVSPLKVLITAETVDYILISQ